MEDETWQRLKSEIESWIGTPFFAGIGGRAKKGVAADCVAFVAQAYANAGKIPVIQWPPYVVSGGGPDMLTLLLSVMDGIDRLLPLWKAKPNGEIIPALEPGDILVCSTGKALHHLAVYMGDNRVVHCLEAGGVQEGNVTDTVIANHLVGLYRLRA